MRPLAEERTAMERAFHDNARALIALLPGNWTPDTTHCFASWIRARREDGVCIALELDAWNARISISPSVPATSESAGGVSGSLRDWGIYDATLPSATCALARGNDAIARDIMRKVVEPYVPLYARIQAVADERGLYRQQTITNVQRLGAVIGIDPDRALKAAQEGQAGEISWHAGSPSYTGIGTIRVSGAQVDVTLRDLSVESAMEILALATRLRAAKRG